MTVRRGGSLTDADHRLLARWAADCAEHVLDLFAADHPDDPRPACAIGTARAWAAGEVTMTQARAAAVAAHAAARDTSGAACLAARAAGHAAAVAHMADHELGAAYYALRAVQSAHPDDRAAVRQERDWQQLALPQPVSALVVDDMAKRAAKFGGVFTEGEDTK